jgi:hypothetical protein
MNESNINKQLLGTVLLCLCLSVLTFAKVERKDYNPSVPCYYTTTGRINDGSKIWVGRIAVTSASGQTVDISSAGFTTIMSVNINPENNTATATAMPNMSVKVCSTTQLTFNTLVPNQVGLLGAWGLVAPTVLTGMYANIEIIGQ